jgi:hypothetical protein
VTVRFYEDHDVTLWRGDVLPTLSELESASWRAADIYRRECAT